MAMKDISEKTGLSIGLIIVLLGLLGGAFVTAVGAIYQVGEHDKKIEKLEAKNDALQAQIVTLQTSAAVSTTQITTLTTSFEGLSRDLRDFMAEMRSSRNVNNANWRPRGPGQ